MKRRNNVVGTIAPAKDDYTIIIPAAAMGKRMKSYGPKNLLEISDNLTILDNQLNIINRVFKNRCEIIMVVGFQKEKFSNSKKNMKIVYNDDYANNNVTKSIGIGLQHATTNNVIVIYGDLVFNINTFNAPFGYYSMLIIDKAGTMPQKQVGCTINKNIIEQVMYDLPNKWGQIAFFTGYELEVLKTLCANKKYDKYFGFETINEIIERDGVFVACSPKDMKIIDIDSSKDILKIGNII